MWTNTRRAFTIVELLVVIAIIGVLTAILLPAVGAARRAAQLNACQNNIRQLATAANAYHTGYNRFPGYNDRLKGGGQPFSWPVTLLPYLDRSDIYDRVREWAISSSSPFMPPQLMTHVSLFVCPVDDYLDATTGGRKEDGPGISYVANAGRADREFHADGVFFNFAQTGLHTNNDLIRDGTTKTLLLSENLSATSWPALSGKPEMSGGMQPNTIFVWHNTLSDNPLVHINGIPAGQTVPQQVPLTSETARPSSNHPGGVSAAFCDGHVQFLNSDINYLVYMQLMTSDSRSQKNIIPQLQNYILNDTDFMP